MIPKEEFLTKDDKVDLLRHMDRNFRRLIVIMVVVFVAMVIVVTVIR